MEKCPGQDLGRKKPEDVVSYAPCPKCNYDLEFWYDEVKRKCPECNYLVKKDLAQILKDYKCALWCDSAELCIGKDNYKKVEKFKETLEKEGDLEKNIKDEGGK